MVYEFDDCVLDEERCELHRAGRPVALQPKVLALLLYLLNHRDRVVGKDELLDAVWTDAAVTEGSLTRAINLARAAVGDAGRAQGVIRTYARRGYRFCAEVVARGESDAEVVPEVLATARAAYEAREWSEAVRHFRSAAEQQALSPDDLEALAWAQRWTADAAASVDSFAKAQTAFARAGEVRPAARLALQLVRVHTEQGDSAPAAGWMRRAISLLEDEPECEEHGLLEWIKGRASWDRGDLSAAKQFAHQAREIGRRVGSRDVEALALLDLGHNLQGLGDVEEAVSLLDEAAAVAMGGELDVQTAGTIYCSVIWACRNRGDWERAGQWTERSIRWCEETRVSYFPGLCRMHRAEVLRLRADFEEAEREVLCAIDDLLASAPAWASSAYNELGEIRLRRGDLVGAQEAFRRSIELGMNPEPGLSKLRVEQGDPEGALRGLERALADKRLDAQERRVLLLCEKISVAIAKGDRESASAALRELDENPDAYASPAHTALVLYARGEIALAEGRLKAALDSLHESRHAWSEAGAPYEAARVQVLIAQVLQAEDDASAATLELEAARSTFERLGAALDARRVSARLAGLAARGQSAMAIDRSTRTFLFTDIVGSTQLVAAVGDEHWEVLRRWHHRTLQAAFQAHGGEVVGPHEGDGFFVAFTNAAAAVECAAEIQKTLAAHRHEHGFAPPVRIGAHTAEALRRGGEYAGVGIHVASRVAAAAEGGEILVTRATRDASGERLGYQQADPLQIADSEDEIETFRVEWRPRGASNQATISTR